MTGRRSTRAGSKEPTAAPQATPRRSNRRAGSSVVSSRRAESSVVESPLPAVDTKESTSYGSSVAVLPLEINRTIDDVDLATSLADIMQPVNESVAARTRQTAGTGPNPSVLQSSAFPPATRQSAARDSVAQTPSRGRGRGSRQGMSVSSFAVGPDTSRSFQNENSVFGDATFEDNSSAVVSPAPESPAYAPRSRRVFGTPGFNTIVEDPEPIDQNEARRPVAGESRLDFMIRTAQARREAQRLAVRPWYAWIVDFWKRFYDFIFSTMFRFIANLFRSIFIAFPVGTAQWVKSFPAVMVFLVVFALFACQIELSVFGGPSSSGSMSHYIQSYGADLSHNIAQFVPHALIHPLNYFNEGDMLDLQKRMSAAEKDISWLKKRASLDKESIQHLEELLPDYVVFKKNKFGKKEIPNEFWLALKDRIMQEPVLLKEQSDAKETKGATPNENLSTAQVKKIAEDAWTEFLQLNEARIKMLQGEEFDDLWSKNLKDSFKNDLLVEKSELIKMLRQSWDDSKAMIVAEVGKITAQIDRAILDLPDPKQEKKIDAEHIERISTKVFKKLISKTQLKALVNAMLEMNVNHGMVRVNHFSVGNGAVINPKFTSPIYPQPHQRGNIFRRAYLALIGRPLERPNRPVEVLRRWDEQGDCWCSPSKGKGEGAQLAIITSHAIYPDQIIIEHIPTEATLDHGSTPKQMELWAKIDGWSDQSIVSRYSDRAFPSDQPGPESGLDGTWERIGKWTYRAATGNNIQLFELQVRMRDLKVSTSQLIVRAKNNWGNLDHTCIYRVRIHGDVAPP